MFFQERTKRARGTECTAMRSAARTRKWQQLPEQSEPLFSFVPRNIPRNGKKSHGGERDHARRGWSSVGHSDDAAICRKIQPPGASISFFASHASTARTLFISAVQLQTACRRHTTLQESSPLLFFSSAGETVRVMFFLWPLVLHPHPLCKSQHVSYPKYSPSNLV